MTYKSFFKANDIPNAIPLAKALIHTAQEQGASTEEFRLALSIAIEEIDEQVEKLSLDVFSSNINTSNEYPT